VLFSLVVAATVAVAASGFVGYAPNRLVSGEPIALWVAADGLSTTGIVMLGAMLLAACLMTPSKALHFVVAVLAAALLLLALAAAGHAASILSIAGKPASRTSLGAAFWVLIACATLAVVDALQRLGVGPYARIFAVIAIASGAVVLANVGTFDARSLPMHCCAMLRWLRHQSEPRSRSAFRSGLARREIRICKAPSSRS
jgi:osmoprotectant transport system permease protein